MNKKKRYFEWSIHLLCWVIGYVLILNYVTTILDFRASEGPFWLSILVGTLVNQLVFYGTAFGVVPRFLPQRDILRLGFVLLFGLLVVNLSETVIDYYFLVGHFSTENESFESYFFYNFTINGFMMVFALAYAFSELLDQ